jgi:hypothetical protein
MTPSTNLQFYCFQDQQASVENIISMVPERYLSKLPSLAVYSGSTSTLGSSEISSPSSVKQSLLPMDSHNPDFQATVYKQLKSSLDSFGMSNQTNSLLPQSTPPPSKPQLVFGTATGITDFSTVNYSPPRSYPLAKASSKNSLDSGSDLSYSDESSISHLNTLYPHWKQNARTFADQRLISYAASKPGFDFEGFNRLFDKMVIN